jgi:hypothetical protein
MCWITKILDAHDVEHEIINGKLIAFETVYNDNTKTQSIERTNLTDCKVHTLQLFLGYSV